MGKVIYSIAACILALTLGEERLPVTESPDSVCPEVVAAAPEEVAAPAEQPLEPVVPVTTDTLCEAAAIPVEEPPSLPPEPILPLVPAYPVPPTAAVTTTTTTIPVTTTTVSVEQVISYPCPAPEPMVWNLAEDFRRAPNQANPNPDSYGNPDVWNFLRSSSLQRDPQTYVPLSHFLTDALDLEGIHGWQGPNPCSHIATNDDLPVVAVNTTGRFQLVYSISWQPGEMLMHPDRQQLAIVGWRSPMDGVVSIVGSFKDMDAVRSGGVAWFIDHGDKSLARGAVSEGSKEPFAISDVHVRKGDFVYFLVDPDGDFGCDSTALDLTITYSAPLGR